MPTMKEALQNIHETHWTPSFNCDCGACYKHQDPADCITCIFLVDKITNPNAIEQQ